MQHYPTSCLAQARVTGGVGKVKFANIAAHRVELLSADAFRRWFVTEIVEKYLSSNAFAETGAACCRSDSCALGLEAAASGVKPDRTGTDSPRKLHALRRATDNAAQERPLAHLGWLPTVRNRTGIRNVPLS